MDDPLVSPIRVYNLVFDKFSDVLLQNSSLEIFWNTRICFVLCDCLFKKILLRDYCLCGMYHSTVYTVIMYFQTWLGNEAAAIFTLN